jgi:DNA-directed RNA polymerase sigma subunit (sigma70/sigma32)
MDGHSGNNPGGASMNYPIETDGLKIYLSQIEHYPVLSRKDENELAVRYRDKNDAKAGQMLITSNLRFVIKVALGYRNYGVRLMDLIQEGNIGLMKAVERYDPDKGYRLISYAIWWIRAYIQNYIIRSWSLVKIGTTDLVDQGVYTELHYPLVVPGEDRNYSGSAQTLLPDFRPAGSAGC